MWSRGPWARRRRTLPRRARSSRPRRPKTTWGRPSRARRAVARSNRRSSCRSTRTCAHRSPPAPSSRSPSTPWRESSRRLLVRAQKNIYRSHARYGTLEIRGGGPQAGAISQRGRWPKIRASSFRTRRRNAPPSRAPTRCSQGLGAARAIQRERERERPPAPPSVRAARVRPCADATVSTRAGARPPAFISRVGAQFLAGANWMRCETALGDLVLVDADLLRLVHLVVRDMVPRVSKRLSSLQCLCSRPARAQVHVTTQSHNRTTVVHTKIETRGRARGHQ